MEQEQSTETSTEPTLDQVYKEFNVEAEAANFRPQQQAPQQQQPQVQPQQPPSNQVPDPVLRPDDFRSHYAADINTLRTSQSQLASQLQTMTAAAQRQVEEMDIRAAVDSVKRAGFEADPDFIEVALGQKARQDPRFLSVYNNRAKNPNAWGKALAAVANEFKGKYSFKADPQLTENVRAARQSTQTSLTTKDAPSGNQLEDAFKGKSGRDFDAAWSDHMKHNMN